MYEKESFIPTMSYFFNFLRKKQPIQTNDIGIYRDVVIIDTLNDGNKSLKYEFFVKVRAIGVYNKLVEIEILDISTSNTCNQDVYSIVQDNIPRFLNPNLIQWEIKQPSKPSQVKTDEQNLNHFTTTQI